MYILCCYCGAAFRMKATIPSISSSIGICFTSSLCVCALCMLVHQMVEMDFYESEHVLVECHTGLWNA